MQPDRPSSRKHVMRVKRGFVHGGRLPHEGHQGVSSVLPISAKARVAHGTAGALQGTFRCKSIPKHQLTDWRGGTPACDAAHSHLYCFVTVQPGSAFTMHLERGLQSGSSMEAEFYHKGHQRRLISSSPIQLKHGLPRDPCCMRNCRAFH
jgi:hypothetical protein